MDFNFAELVEDFRWFFELGYVTVIATILTILLTQLWKATFLKNALSTADSTKKDKILSLAGTITSFVVYAIVWFANQMIVQKTFFISFDVNNVVMTIPSGAVTTWLAAKGLYTLIHKWWNRLPDKKESTADSTEEVTAGSDQVAATIATSNATAKIATASIGAVPASTVASPTSVHKKTRKLL